MYADSGWVKELPGTCIHTDWQSLPQKCQCKNWVWLSYHENVNTISQIKSFESKRGYFMSGV